ncbi:type II secretion system F family protein [Mucilaginibacter sp. ZT4R22]|uniref:General secretion pathway protein F n=1 Tax=Mucilaginibacter pankratovii TaxID=2772110 RepID=A0ABR7WNC5_9SPHI|nr:type II secretion system F family protein [Mucilaginibacter pankratovii]MBD1363819.1 type II secretion system F family protein [Mucilaginibacter pankratovii]
MPSIDISRYNQKPKPGTADNKGQGVFDFLNKDISFGSGQLADKKKESLYVELGSLLQAGINLKESLELITVEQEKVKDKQLFLGIQKAVVNGASFSAALRQGGKFSTYEIFSLQIGEESGKLNEVLQDLAKYFQNKVKQRRKVISALTYPCIVMFTSLSAVFFMLKVVVPMFGDVFIRFGGKLPYVTEKIIQVSKLLEHNFLWISFLIAVIIIGLYTVRKTERFRALSSVLILKLPVIGNLAQKIYLARFCNSMRLLINAKLPLLQAISLVRQMISYYPIEKSLQAIEKDITNGKPLHQSLQQYTVYPPKMIQLLKVAEETNQLDFFFGRLSEQYIEEVEYKTDTLSNAMEPLIIIFLGIIVGGILVAMYLPLFQMSNSFQ